MAINYVVALHAVAYSAALAAGAAGAVTVVDHPLAAEFSGAYSNLGSSNQQIADDFTLAGSSIMQGMSWYGRYDDAAVLLDGPVSFSVRFFADAAGTPVANPFALINVGAVVVDSGEKYAGLPWFRYHADLPSIAIGPGQYWVSVLETDIRSPVFGVTQWLWGNSSSAGVRAFRAADGQFWTNDFYKDHAFTLVATQVPEASTAALLLLGLLGIAYRPAR